MFAKSSVLFSMLIIACSVLNVSYAMNNKQYQQSYPLHVAVKCENQEEAGRLIKSGCDVNEQDNDGVTPLHWACARNNEPLARLLLANGATTSINLQSPRGNTPLHAACGQNNEPLACLLLAHGAATSINLQNKQGRTPLDWACCKSKSLRQLLENWATRLEAAMFMQASHPRLGKNSPARVSSPYVAHYICTFLSSPINEEN